MASSGEWATLNNGTKIPMVGLGTWKSKPGEVGEAVRTALSIGVRHIDCAYNYSNEGEIGDAIQAKIKDGTVARKDFLVTSKLWNGFHEPERVREGFERSLKLLKLDYLDVYLIHWPVALKYTPDYDDQFPRDADGKLICIDADFLDTYKEMEKLVDEGLVKTIGVSNFNSKQIQRILDNCRIRPSILQIEVHPFNPSIKIVEYAQANGIAVVAYSPFASPDRAWAKPTDPNVFKSEMIQGIAKRIDKSPAQVALRYLVQRRILVIPKSVSEGHMRNNMDIFSFTLSPEDMNTLNNSEVKYKACPGVVWAHSSYFPFNEEF